MEAFLLRICPGSVIESREELLPLIKPRTAVFADPKYVLN
jgi:hypothetical protein